MKKEEEKEEQNKKKARQEKTKHQHRRLLIENENDAIYKHNSQSHFTQERWQFLLIFD